VETQRAAPGIQGVRLLYNEKFFVYRRKSTGSETAGELNCWESLE